MFNLLFFRCIIVVIALNNLTGILTASDNYKKVDDSRNNTKFETDLGPITYTGTKIGKDKKQLGYLLSLFRKCLNCHETIRQSFSKESEIPSSVDWRKKGFVTSVKDQGNCKSSWAFSAVGSLEGQVKRVTGILESLSVQNLIDCPDNIGCSGGRMDLAFMFIIDNGISNNLYSPYRGRQVGVCHTYDNTLSRNVTAYATLPVYDEEQLKIAVAIVGPISVAIHVNDNLMGYESGVYYDETCKNGFYDVNHGVLVVGYGTDPEFGDYWLVKNSWGTNWGEEGYIRMARNKNNHCGIANIASYPVVE